MVEPCPILLAEDNAYDAELTMKALGEAGLANRIVHVSDGAQALDYLRRQGPWANRTTGNPVVVILDIKMPLVDGIEVLDAIRADPELKLLPVVMLSSSSEKQDLQRSYELGSNAYVVKPVKFAEFIPAVREIGVFWALINEKAPTLN